MEGYPTSNRKGWDAYVMRARRIVIKARQEKKPGTTICTETIKLKALGISDEVMGSGWNDHTSRHLRTMTAKQFYGYYFMTKTQYRKQEKELEEKGERDNKIWCTSVPIEYR